MDQAQLMTPHEIDLVDRIATRQAKGDTLPLNQRLFVEKIGRRVAREREPAMTPADTRYLRSIAEKLGLEVPNASGDAEDGGAASTDKSGALPFHSLANIFPLIEGDEFDELVGSIRDNGLREPIVLHDCQILDGRNRYRACRVAGADPRFTELPETSDPLQFVIDHNLRRRHLTDDQRRMVAARIADLGQGRPEKNFANSEVKREAAAKLLSVDLAGVDRAKSVVNHGVDELIDSVDRGDASVSAAATIAKLDPDAQRQIIAEVAKNPDTKKAFKSVVSEVRRETQDEKKERRAERERDLAHKQHALPDKKYGVILADPEWQFAPRSDETGMDRAAGNHYPTSPVEVIASRPIATVAATDCVLALWATIPMLPQAIEVMMAWGFTYRSHVVWRKAEVEPGEPLDRSREDRGLRSRGLVLGTGYWFRCAHELLLIGTKGNPVAPAMGEQFPSIVDARPLRHSQKPDRFYELIEAYFPNLPKIELNARSGRPGWDSWGNEAPDQEAPPHDPETGELGEGDA